MALRDLTVSGAQLTEQQIEELIGPYARYDPEAGTIVLLPPAAKLSLRQRVLLYLVALQGWPFVTDAPHATTARPGPLSEALRVGGGTVRPLLMAMKEEHLVLVTAKGEYSVAIAALDSIREELNRQSKPRSRRAAGQTAKLPTLPQVHRLPKPSAATEAQSPRPAPSRPRVVEKSAGSVPRRKGKRHGGESAVFVPWVEAGYFDQFRTFGEILERFHAQGRMLKSTSLPGYLLEATRAGVLDREKKDINGKRVWVYTAPKRRAH